MGEARSIITRATHCRVGIGENGIECAVFVDDDALHTVFGINFVPQHHVPEAPVVHALETVAMNGISDDTGMLGIRYLASIITAHFKYGG